MSFKLTPPFNKFPTPVVNISLEEESLGRANNRGNILLNKNIKDPKQIDDIISHESIHIEQMQRGDLDYDDKTVYWKGKKYPRSKMNEGAKNLPWEVEAYKKS